MADRSLEIMRIAEEIAELTADCDDETARGIADAIISCAMVGRTAKRQKG